MNIFIVSNFWQKNLVNLIPGIVNIDKKLAYHSEKWVPFYSCKRQSHGIPPQSIIWGKHWNHLTWSSFSKLSIHNCLMKNSCPNLKKNWSRTDNFVIQYFSYFLQEQNKGCRESRKDKVIIYVCGIIIVRGGSMFVDFCGFTHEFTSQRMFN